MSDQSNFDEEVFGAFSPEERETARRIWQESRDAAPEGPELTEDEVEQALSQVHRQMPTGRWFPTAWRWVAAAAVILLILGAGILVVPRTASAPRGELATVILPDGSTVQLNSGSDLQYGYLYGITNRSVNLNGEAFFTIEKGERPFMVQAHGATVRVTGTKFNVRTWGGDPQANASVAVAEGQVQFYPEGHRPKAVLIAPGQLSKWSAGMDRPTDPRPVSVDQVTGWRKHKLIFDQKPLSVIIPELERRFDTTIRLEAPGMAGETLTTYYSSSRDVESILKDICRVKGLRFARTSQGYRIYK